MKEQPRNTTTVTSNKGWYDRFLESAGSLEQVALFRVGYAALLLVCLVFWWLDGARLFSDEGLMSGTTAQSLVFGYQLSLFDVLPAEPWLVQFVLSICILQTLCLAFGIFSRFQAVCIFIWLATFQHRNPIVCDGEDTLFRIFAFFLIFMPLDAKWSLAMRFRSQDTKVHTSTWALRLVQLQISIVYASTAWAKWQGMTWRDGSATYLVLQMPDLYGRGWVPGMLSESEWLLRLATWAVVLVEALLPFALWIPKTRQLAVAVALLMHLTIEYTMHLFLFEWIMILGLSTFVDWNWLVGCFLRTKNQVPENSNNQADRQLSQPRMPANVG